MSSDFPPCPYSPLRPQTTIAIDHVKIVNSETQPSVKIIVVFCANLQNDFNLYHTGNLHDLLSPPVFKILSLTPDAPWMLLYIISFRTDDSASRLFIISLRTDDSASRLFIFPLIFDIP
jgi:hypothetical protein